MSFQLVVFDARRGNTEGEEADKLLGFYPESTPLAERISLAGLVQGLHMFSASLERPEVRWPFLPPFPVKSGPHPPHLPTTQVVDSFEVAETDQSTWATLEGSPGVFIALVAAKAWLPRHASQDALRALLLHAHHLMHALFGGVQALLDADASGAAARGAVAVAMASLGRDLADQGSWPSRELRNSLTTMGSGAALALPLPITLDVHSLCHRAAVATEATGVALFFSRSVLWSSLTSTETAALCALAHSPAIPGPGEAGAPLEMAAGRGGGWAVLTQVDDSGLYALLPHDADPDSFRLPSMFGVSSGQHLLACGRGDLLLAATVTRATVPAAAAAALQRAIDPMVIQLLARLGQECQAQGGELGHVAGWRYCARDDGAAGVRASPRPKVSTMSHHARAVTTAMADSLSRAGEPEEGALEVCVRSAQGTWAAARVEAGGRRAVVVREKRLDGDTAQCIDAIDASLDAVLAGGGAAPAPAAVTPTRWLL